MALSDKLQQIGANAEEIGAEVDALLAYANETTGASDTRLGDALRTLAKGYGGEIPGINVLEFTPREDITQSNRLIIPFQMPPGIHVLAIMAKRIPQTETTRTGAIAWVRLMKTPGTPLVSQLLNAFLRVDGTIGSDSAMVAVAANTVYIGGPFATFRGGETYRIISLEV